MSIDRKYSDGSVWANSIDFDDNPDGSEGGYDSRGNYILPDAMREIVQARRSLDDYSQVIAKSAKRHTLLINANHMLSRYFDECTDSLCAENITEKEADYYVNECERISEILQAIEEILK